MNRQKRGGSGLTGVPGVRCFEPCKGQAGSVSDSACVEAEAQGPEPLQSAKELTSVNIVTARARFCEVQC